MGAAPRSSPSAPAEPANEVPRDALIEAGFTPALGTSEGDESALLQLRVEETV